MAQIDQKTIFYDIDKDTHVTNIIHGSGSYNTLGTDSKMNQYNTHILPFKVKKIKCAGEYEIEYTLYWTIDNKLYLVGSRLENNKLFNCVKFIDKNDSNLFWNFFEIDLNKLLKKENNENNNNFIKNIKCSGNCILFELIDKKVIVMDCRSFQGNENKFYEYSFPNLKRIKRGCVSNHLVFLMNNNEIKWIDTTDSKYELIDLPTFTFGNIKHLALSNKSLIVVTNENKMYGFGSNKEETVNSVELDNKQWTYIHTIFENESKVKSLKCGYSHCVVLLENGNIYGCGLNSLEQAGQPNASRSDDHLPTFMKFAFPVDFVDKIESVYGMSRGTILQTSKEFICIGEIARDSGSDFGDLHAVRLERKYGINHVTTGPWHCIFYFKEKHSSKDLIYFTNNLQRIVNNTFSLSDIDVFTE
ncbi:hypothetical protein ABK040_007706 [Willaertia magna]